MPWFFWYPGKFAGISVVCGRHRHGLGRYSRVISYNYAPFIKRALRSCQGLTGGSVTKAVSARRRTRSVVTFSAAPLERRRQPEASKSLRRHSRLLCFRLFLGQRPLNPQVVGSAEAIDGRAFSLRNLGKPWRLSLNVCFRLPIQPVDATHAANRSAGVS